MKKYYKFIFDSSQEYKLIALYLIIRLFIFRKLSFLNKKYYNQYISLNSNHLDYKKNGHFTQDWFSYNIKYLSRVLYKYNLHKKKLNILELGSFEGLSTVFFLTTLKYSKIYCVDPFIDFEENKDKDFNQIFENFKYNTKNFQNRIRLSKSTSDLFFENIDNEKFDLIYIDGNHRAENVFKDAKNSFKSLKRGGFIIFDDFLWNYYDKINLNPIGAIKKFIFKNFFNIKIVSIGYQLVIQKK